MYPSAIRTAWFRYLLHYPGQLVLAITGIALGVAVVVSIDLAKESALDAFVQATETISNKASHRIVGHSGTVDERLYPQLRLSDLPLHFFPKIEGDVKIDNHSGEKLRILGIDPFAETGFGSIATLIRGSQMGPGTSASNIAKILTEPGFVVVSESTVQRLNRESTQDLNIITGGRKKTLKIAALAKFSDPLKRQAMEDLILTDMASAQEILELFGRISRIDVVVPNQAMDPTALHRLKQQLPNDTELISYQQINQNARGLTASFYTNLTALSLLSLMVGMFLIYNTINFLTLRRRSLIGMLRALGASRWQIFKLVVSESATLGLVGTLVGLLLGSLLAYGLLELISNTIDNVYFALPTPKLLFSLPTFIKGLLLGTAVSAVTSLLPATAATRIEPLQAMIRSKLESNTERHAVQSAFFGVSALAMGSITTLISERSVGYGFVGLMLLVFGCALLAPFFLLTVSRFVYPIVVKLFGVLGSLPVRSLNANLSRSGLAVAALMVAIAATIGVQIMVSSFRYSVGDWLEKRLSADLYISASTSFVLNRGPLNDDYLSKISKLAGIRSIGTVRRRSIQRADGVDQIRIYALTAEASQGFDFRSGMPDQVWRNFKARDTVIITESYAYNRQLRVGSIVALTTDTGRKKFKIAGIYADYNPGQGIIAMSRATYRRHWNDDGYSAFSVYTEPGTDLKRLKRKLHAHSDPDDVLDISEQSKIIAASMLVFDQAFAVTDILQWLAATIAILGVFSVLMAIQLDRIREYGILRANGVTANQLAILITAESSLMGSVAGLLALPVGIMIAVVLIFVINQRSFGWSMSFHLPPEIILQGLMSGIIAAVLAGLIPSFRMSRLSPGEALRNE